MSSVNPHYTFQYSQPREYHFSHDSVFLARRAFEFFRPEEIAELEALDLCSGCGIIGLDFMFHARKEHGVEPRLFDFLEVQDVYREHFEKNLKALSPQQTRVNFLQQNYDKLLSGSFQQKYDLVLCNPPYFHVGQGTLSPSDFKNRCRFFMDADFKTLISAVQSVLKPKGNAFLLLRDQKDHGWNVLQEMSPLLSAEFSCEVQDDIRGTGLVRIHRSL